MTGARWCPVFLAIALGVAGGTVRAQESPAASADISIGVDTPEIKTGLLGQNNRGEREPLAVPVVIAIQNRSGRPASTTAEMSGPHAHFATVKLEKTEETADGQNLHLKVLGEKPSFEETETKLIIEVSQDGKVKARKSLPVRVVVPMMTKTTPTPLYEGPASPGLVNRALNMRTIPKASVPFPEAKLAAMCLHDLTMTVLDQFGKPLPPIYERAPVWAALGKSDYETTNRRLRADSTFIDTLGLWQFVGEVPNITIDPGRAQVQEFVSRPAPPCTRQQYAAYEPLTVQWQIGGFPIGTYERQITLMDSGDDHKPHIRITLKPIDDPAPKTTNQ
jgi:hypothetical protein